MKASEDLVRQTRETSFGTGGLTLVDRFGIWLSRRAILRQTRGRANLDVLEIGCGYDARNLLAIADHAACMTGLDFNLSPALARLPGFRAIEGSFNEALPHLGDRQYDLIMMISVLEHLDDPGGVLHACREMLRPSGLLLVNVPTWRGKVFLEYSAFKLRFSPKEEMDDHKMYYDKRDLWPILVKSGFLPSHISMRYHKFGLNLFAAASKGSN
jgi:2-polyprenyl-3-methyl-5-hydroxy-6-metoxy-1,4-benzoquinol methylase